MMRKKLWLSVIMLGVITAGCAAPKAWYKPGLAVDEVAAEYHAISHSVLRTGPIVRSARDEVRVLLACLEAEGFREVPVSELPEGVVVRTEPINDYLCHRFAGLPEKQ